MFKANSQSELAQLLSNARQKLTEPNKSLTIRRQDGTLLTTVATATSFKVEREAFRVTFVPVSIAFEVYDPFFYGTQLYNEEFLQRSTSFADTIDYTVGEQKARPVVSINFGTVSGVTDIVVTV
ncbi:MAG: hypothetical protein AB8F78_05135 [Saprospiraceae bacterium]